MTTLSVVIPTYNRSALVVEAVESVLAQQTDEQVETIVIDDGSTDDTQQALQRFGDRIKYRYQRNAGMNAARNVGVRESAGKYVAFLDSDDVWLPCKAAIQIAVMERLTHVGFAFSNFFAWRAGTRTPNGLAKWMVPGASIDACATRHLSSTYLDIRTPAPFEIKLCDIYRLSLYQPVVLPSTSILRRNVLEDLGPLSEDNWMCGDWEYFARASKRFGTAYIDTETALNRSHDDSVRLMRRPLAERTRQRIASIRRTWRADADFMAKFRSEVDRVEGAEWRVLFKRTCLEGELVEARDQLREIERLSGRPTLGLKVLYRAMHVSFARRILAQIRAFSQSRAG